MIHIFHDFFGFLGHTWRCTGVAPGSVLMNHPWQCSGDHMGCWESNPGPPRARQMPYPLYYCSIPCLLHLVWSGGSYSTAGRAFALHTANLGSIPPPLSESLASYWEYLAQYLPRAWQAPRGVFNMPKIVTSLTTETLLVPAQANPWAMGWQWQWQGG